MTVRENHLLFDWRREVREWEGGGREEGEKEGGRKGWRRDVVWVLVNMSNCVHEHVPAL